MAHCGYEPTAVHATFGNPLKALWTTIRGVRTDGPMAPEISLDHQRPAQFVFSRHVEQMLTDIKSKPQPTVVRREQAEIPAAVK
jgi:hypothetical protein